MANCGIQEHYEALRKERLAERGLLYRKFKQLEKVTASDMPGRPMSSYEQQYAARLIGLEQSPQRFSAAYKQFEISQRRADLKSGKLAKRYNVRMNK